MSSQQSQTTADTPADNTLCKMGCGFFGNGATDNCCSKCFHDLQKKKEANMVCAPAPVQAPPAAVKPMAPIETEEPSPMDVDIPTPADEEEKPVPTPAATTPKKKKKKASYKNMMKGMMTNTQEKDADKEMESLRKGLGGGNFSKIEKI